MAGTKEWKWRRREGRRREKKGCSRGEAGGGAGMMKRRGERDEMNEVRG